MIPVISLTLLCMPSMLCLAVNLAIAVNISLATERKGHGYGLGWQVVNY